MSCLLAAVDVYGPLNERMFESGCKIRPNFTCEGLVVVEQPCADDICCDALETPDQATGTGYLQFSDICLSGGAGCLRLTGCEFCFNATSGAENADNLPVCHNETISGGIPPEGACSDQECCTLQANPNIATGQGYLVFDTRCFEGGEHCVDSSGCALCWNQLSGAENVGNRPVCPQSVVEETDSRFFGGLGNVKKFLNTHMMKMSKKDEIVTTMAINSASSVGIVISMILASILFLFA